MRGSLLLIIWCYNPFDAFMAAHNETGAHMFTRRKSRASGRSYLSVSLVRTILLMFAPRSLEKTAFR
jgi:hypothetical protein